MFSIPFIPNTDRKGHQREAKVRTRFGLWMVKERAPLSRGTERQLRREEPRHPRACPHFSESKRHRRSVFFGVGRVIDGLAADLWTPLRCAIELQSRSQHGTPQVGCPRLVAIHYWNEERGLTFSAVNQPHKWGIARHCVEPPQTDKFLDLTSVPLHLISVPPLLPNTPSSFIFHSFFLAPPGLSWSERVSRVFISDRSMFVLN